MLSDERSDTNRYYPFTTIAKLMNGFWIQVIKVANNQQASRV